MLRGQKLTCLCCVDQSGSSIQILPEPRDTFFYKITTLTNWRTLLFFEMEEIIINLSSAKILSNALLCNGQKFPEQIGSKEHAIPPPGYHALPTTEKGVEIK